MSFCSIRGLVFFRIAASRSLAQAPPDSPKVLRITRQTVQPGRAAAHERIWTLAAHAMARTKYPANLLARRVNRKSGFSNVLGVTRGGRCFCRKNTGP